MLSFREKIAKIGPADLEIICLREIIKDQGEKKKEITEGKIYSPFGNLAERAKLENAWQSLAYWPLGAIVSPPSEY